MNHFVGICGAVLQVMGLLAALANLPAAFAGATGQFLEAMLVVGLGVLLAAAGALIGGLDRAEARLAAIEAKLRERPPPPPSDPPR